jgi:hypothetical protein
MLRPFATERVRKTQLWGLNRSVKAADVNGDLFSHSSYALKQANAAFVHCKGLYGINSTG